MSDADVCHWAHQETSPYIAPETRGVDPWGPKDASTPVPLPVEDDPDEGVRNVEYAPVSAAAVSADQRGHLDYLDPWHHMQPIDRDHHKQTCNGCDLCADHRVEGLCKWEGINTVAMEDGNCTCGSPILHGTDYSDVKATER